MDSINLNDIPDFEPERRKPDVPADGSRRAEAVQALYLGYIERLSPIEADYARQLYAAMSGKNVGWPDKAILRMMGGDTLRHLEIQGVIQHIVECEDGLYKQAQEVTKKREVSGE